jgi:hypothetical protein
VFDFDYAFLGPNETMDNCVINIMHRLNTLGATTIAVGEKNKEKMRMQYKNKKLFTMKICGKSNLDTKVSAFREILDELKSDGKRMLLFAPEDIVCAFAADDLPAEGHYACVLEPLQLLNPDNRQCISSLTEDLMSLALMIVSVLSDIPDRST